MWDVFSLETQVSSRFNMKERNFLVAPNNLGLLLLNS